MSINLLPEQEKSKIKPTNKASVTQIEMTGPRQGGNKKPAAKESGVLTFFKQAFTKPGAPQTDEKKFPEKKVRIMERPAKKAAHKPETQKQPEQNKKVVYIKPSDEGMQADKSKGILEKVLDFFRSLFSAGTPRNQPAEKSAAVPEPKEEFPTYKPITTKQVSDSNHVDTSQDKIIEVTTSYQSDDEQAAKPAAVPADVREEMPGAQPIVRPTRTSTPAQPIQQPEDKHEKETIELERTDQPVPRDRQYTDQQSKTVAEKKPDTDRQNALIRWLQGVLQTIKNLFTREKKPVSSPPPTERGREADSDQLPKISLEKSTENIHIPEAADRKTALDDLPPPPSPPAEDTSEAAAATPAAELQKKSVPDDIDPSPAPVLESEIDAAPQPTELSRPAASIKPGKHPPKKEKKDNEIAMTSPQEQEVKPALQWEVNLIPEDAVEVRIPVSRYLYLALVGIVCAGLVFGGWIAANWYYNNITTDISEVNTQISSVEIQINQKKNVVEQVQYINQQAEHVASLIDEHVYWSPLFTKIESYVAPEVYFTSMNADVNGVVTLTAVGENYEAAVKQLYVLERAADFVQQASVENISFVSEGAAMDTETQASVIVDRPVNFSIKLTVDPLLFSHQ